MITQNISITTNLVRGEIEVGENLEIVAKIPRDYGYITEFKALFNKEGEKPSIIKNMVWKEEKDGMNIFTTNVCFTNSCNYYYYFTLSINGRPTNIKISRQTNQPFFTDEESPYWSVLVIQKDFEVPSWAKGATYYQIFVDRFNRTHEIKKISGRNYRNWNEMPQYKRNNQGEFHNNDFFGGNLKGIEEKLFYFKKLGVTVLYLSPINFSLFRYDRYAATDHMQIDPNVGTFEDLDSLHQKANKLGIHIILDIALNHCCSDNPIFQDAISNPQSKYRNWFYIDENGNYRYWYGEFKDMPVFNQECKEYQDYVYGENGVIAKFAKYVDGFRLDVAEELSETVLTGIRKRANQNGAHVIIGECWNRVATHYFGKCLDGTTNYLYTSAMYKWTVYGDAEYFKWQIQNVLENYPAETVCTMLNSLDTHDMVRALTILGGKWQRSDREIWKIDETPSPWHKYINGKIVFLTDMFRQDEADADKLTTVNYKKAKEKLKVISVLQYFLPGNPCIYYGTEVGLHGYKDPFNRKTFPWDRIDKDLFRHFVRLGKCRKKYAKQLSNSKYKCLRCDDKVLIFERKGILVVLNRIEDVQEIVIPKEYQDAKVIFKVKKEQNLMEQIGAYNAIVLRK